MRSDFIPHQPHGSIVARNCRAKLSRGRCAVARGKLQMNAAQKGLGVLGALTFLVTLSLVGLGNSKLERKFARVAVGAVPSDAASGPQTTLLIRFGIADREMTEWNGTITASPGKVERLEPWRFLQG